MSVTISGIVAATQNFTELSGDSWIVDLVFTQSDNVTPLSIAGWIFQLEIKNTKYHGSTDAGNYLKLTMGSGLTITGVSTNVLSISKILKLKEGVYVYDVEATKPDGTVITYLRGQLNVQPDVTNGY